MKARELGKALVEIMKRSGVDTSTASADDINTLGRAAIGTVFSVVHNSERADEVTQSALLALLDRHAETVRNSLTGKSFQESGRYLLRALKNASLNTVRSDRKVLARECSLDAEFSTEDGEQTSRRLLAEASVRHAEETQSNTAWTESPLWNQLVTDLYTVCEHADDLPRSGSGRRPTFELPLSKVFHMLYVERLSHREVAARLVAENVNLSELDTSKQKPESAWQWSGPARTRRGRLTKAVYEAVKANIGQAMTLKEVVAAVKRADPDALHGHDAYQNERTTYVILRRNTDIVSGRDKDGLTRFALNPQAARHNVRHVADRLKSVVADALSSFDQQSIEELLEDARSC